jgi:hypothetical protein
MAKAKEDLNGDGMVTMQEKILAALASYGRHFLGASLAVYAAFQAQGLQATPRDLFYGGMAAVVPVALKALNPNEPSFGFTKK